MGRYLFLLLVLAFLAPGFSLDREQLADNQKLKDNFLANPYMVQCPCALHEQLIPDS